MEIGTDRTLPAMSSISPAARSRWLVGLVVTILVATLSGSGLIVSEALRSIQDATNGAYKVERARIDRMESDLAAVKGEIPTLRERLAGMERDIKFLVESERRRQRIIDLRSLED